MGSSLGNACRRLAPLSNGRLEDGAIVCPYHAWKFDGSGKCVHMPHAQGTPQHDQLIRTEATHLHTAPVQVNPSAAFQPVQHQLPKNAPSLYMIRIASITPLFTSKLQGLANASDLRDDPTDPWR